MSVAWVALKKCRQNHRLITYNKIKNRIDLKCTWKFEDFYIQFRRFPSFRAKKKNLFVMRWRCLVVYLSAGGDLRLGLLLLLSRDLDLPRRRTGDRSRPPRYKEKTVNRTGQHWGRRKEKQEKSDRSRGPKRRCSKIFKNSKKKFEW